MIKHFYGSGFILPARVEPVVRPGNIYITKPAFSVLSEAIKAGKHIKDDTEFFPMGEIPLAKGAGQAEVYWLGRPDENKPPRQASFKQNNYSTYVLLQHHSLRLLNDYVEKFHSWIESDHSIKVITDVFTKYHNQMLKALCLPESGQEHYNVEVLVAKPHDGKSLLLIDEFPSTHQPPLPVPELKIHPGQKNQLAVPRAGDGLATYAFWASTAKQYGVAVMHDLLAPECVYWTRAGADSDKGAGSYTSRNIGQMYNPLPDSNKVPYKALMSVGMSRTLRTTQDPTHDAKYESFGVLNISSNIADIFDHQDAAWAEAAASLLAAAYQCYYRAQDSKPTSTYGRSRSASKKQKNISKTTNARNRAALDRVSGAKVRSARKRNTPKRNNKRRVLIYQ